MTATHSVSSSVEVPTDPHTAFTVFTEELPCWWIQGPINFWHASRAYYIRMEPGVGGRIVEVYDEDTGDGMELGRLTEWEPGSRLAWQSSIDDLTIEVGFDASAGGTLVRVQATISDGGVDNGTTSWVRTIGWFSEWCRTRDHVERQPKRMDRLGVAVYYTKPATAARWLRDVFGLKPAGAIPETDDTDPEHTWIEFHVGNCSVILFKREHDAPESPAPTHTPWVFVDDVDAHYALTTGNGARVVEEMWEHGARAYGVADLEGNHWTFAQASPLMR
jgi:uncharacterized glyoxalase superfamily protein PhnB